MGIGDDELKRLFATEECVDHLCLPLLDLPLESPNWNLKWTCRSVLEDFHVLTFFICTGGTLKCGVWIQNTYNLVNQKFSKLNDSTYCYCTGFRVLMIGSYYPHWCKHKFMNWCCHKLWLSRCWICKTLNHLQVCGHIELESCGISVIISSRMTDVAGGHRIGVRLSYILHKQEFKT